MHKRPAHKSRAARCWSQMVADERAPLLWHGQEPMLLSWVKAAERGP